jgi:hypothetical protein
MRSVPVYPRHDDIIRPTTRGRRPIKKIVLVGGIAAVVVVAGLIVGCFFIGQTLVDIFLIICLLVSIAAFASLAYAGFQIVALVKEMKGEAQTLIGTAQETLAEVQGTVRFVGDNVVAPMAQTAGFVAAVRSTLKSFTEPLFKRRS